MASQTKYQQALAILSPVERAYLTLKIKRQSMLASWEAIQRALDPDTRKAREALYGEDCRDYDTALEHANNEAEIEFYIYRS